MKNNKLYIVIVLTLLSANILAQDLLKESILAQTGENGATSSNEIQLSIEKMSIDTFSSILKDYQGNTRDHSTIAQENLLYQTLLHPTWSSGHESIIVNEILTIYKRITDSNKLSFLNTLIYTLYARGIDINYNILRDSNFPNEELYLLTQNNLNSDPKTTLYSSENNHIEAAKLRVAITNNDPSFLSEVSKDLKSNPTKNRQIKLEYLSSFESELSVISLMFHCKNLTEAKYLTRLMENLSPSHETSLSLLYHHVKIFYFDNHFSESTFQQAVKIYLPLLEKSKRKKEINNLMKVVQTPFVYALGIHLEPFRIERKKFENQLKKFSSEEQIQFLQNLENLGFTNWNLLKDIVYSLPIQVTNHFALIQLRRTNYESASFLLSLIESGKYDKTTLSYFNYIKDRDAIKLLFENNRFQTFTSSQQNKILEVIKRNPWPEATGILAGEINLHSDSINLQISKTLSEVCTSKDVETISGLIKTNGSKYAPYLKDALIKSTSEHPEKKTAFDIIHKTTNDLELAFEISSKVGGPELINEIMAYYTFESYQPLVTQTLINWKDNNSFPELLNLFTQNLSKPIETQIITIEHLLQSIANNSKDQQLLLLRKVLGIANTKQAKIKTINSIGKLNTITAFYFLYNNIATNELSLAFKEAAIACVLPNNDFKGLNGSIVLQFLKETLADNSTSSVQMNNISKYLSIFENNTIGYLPIFNGENLEGWHGYIDQPYALQKMSKTEYQKALDKANDAMTDHWSVIDNEIAFSGNGHNLVSDKIYGDFELYVDWKITKGGDSGIYLRGTPQVQIWDTSRVEVGAQVGSGGLYNNQKHRSTPLTVADNPIGELNTLHIKMVGERVTVHLNGIMVVKNEILENYWNRNESLFPFGTLELQAHGTDLRFRDIYLREISGPDHHLSQVELVDGFKSLFNGSNLNGWTGNKTDYYVNKDGVIELDPSKGGRGNIYTESEYTNFHLKFEFKLTPGANNGLGIHAPLEGDAAYMGKEIQIIDNSAPKWANIKAWQKHGSIYGIKAAQTGFLKPVGEWNTEEVIVKGNKIKVILNGHIIIDTDYVLETKKGTLDGRDHPGIKKKTGHIGFLGHGDPVFFRNIRIKTL